MKGGKNLSEKKIKILYVVSTLGQCGPTSQLLGLIKNLDKEKFEVLVLTLSPEPENSRKQDYIKINIVVDSLNLSRVQFVINGKDKLKKYINKYKPNIIHTSGVRADQVVSKIQSDFLHCMTIRNYAFDDYIAKYGSLIGRIVANLSISAMKKCEYVICCSKTLKSMYEKIMPNKKLYFVQNGVDTKKFEPVEDLNNKNKLRELLGLPTEQTVFLVVGGLIKRKDPITIIRAFKQANVGDKAVLLLLGDGELRDECQKISTTHVIIKGKVNNVEDYLKAADVYVSSSKSEGLPNSVLEAGSSGLGLVLSNIPQHVECVENCKDLVPIFGVGDIDSLAEIIRREVKNQDTEKREIISKSVRTNFSDKKMCNNYERIYLEMVNVDIVL
jgi:glycosyltransferase involved in cell wall biosynthesis